MEKYRARSVRQIVLGGSLCAVASGAAKLSRSMTSGRELAIQLIEPGVWFGGSSTPHTTASYQIEPRGKLVLLVVEQPELQALKAVHPSLAFSLLGLHELLLLRMGEMLEELTDMPLAERLSRQIAVLGKRFGMTDSDGVKLSVPVSQQDLADLTGASRQRVNVEIKALERQGVLKVVQGYLELQPMRLAQHQSCFPGRHVGVEGSDHQLHFALQVRQADRLLRRAPNHLPIVSAVQVHERG